VNRLVNYMNDSFAPKVNRLTRNDWVRSIQDSIMAVMPLILIGSLITLISILNEYAEWWPDFSGINRFSFGLIGLFIAFLVPFYMMERRGHRDRRLVASATGAAVFLYLLSPTFSDAGEIIFLFERFGATGIFAGLIAGLAVSAVMLVFARLSLFKKSTTMPDFIIVWFDSILPIMACLVGAWLTVDVFGGDVFAGLVTAFEPLTAIAQSFWGFVLLYFIGAFLYSFGMSAWILFPLVYPLQLQGIQENVELAAAGQDPTNINTYEVLFSGWVGIGGIGATLPLVIMMAFMARSQRLKAIGRVSLVPSIFNINEPVVFGAPIAFNPILMVPFWINSILPPALVYAALSWGLADIPSKVYQLWYTPFPISTWIVSPGVAGLLLFAFIFALATAVWLPFLRVYDLQVLDEERAEAAEDEQARANGPVPVAESL
jgi:PTS system cellobiose-specific IIC component